MKQSLIRCAMAVVAVMLFSCQKDAREPEQKPAGINEAQLAGRWQGAFHAFDYNNNGAPDSAELGFFYMDAAYWMLLHVDHAAVDTYFSTFAPVQGGAGTWELITGDSLRTGGDLLSKKTNKIFLLNDSMLILQGYSGPDQLQFLGYRKE